MVVPFSFGKCNEHSHNCHSQCFIVWVGDFQIFMVLLGVSLENLAKNKVIKKNKQAEEKFKID